MNRKVSTCKVCGELVGANTKLSHLSEWRMPEKILSFIENGEINKLKLCFDHGADINYKIPERGNMSIICNSQYELDLRLSTCVD